jgi:pentatricopeptide repeat protein
MKKHGVQPDAGTYVVLLGNVTPNNYSLWGKQAYDIISSQNIQWTPKLQTSLLNMYVRCGDLTAASRAFESFCQSKLVPEVVKSNKIISADDQKGKIKTALELLAKVD